MSKEEIEYIVDEDDIEKSPDVNWPYCVALVFKYICTVGLFMTLAQCVSNGKIW